MQNNEVGEDCWARIFSLQRLQSEQESTEEEEMKLQQRMVIMKHLMRKIRSKEEWMPEADGMIKSAEGSAGLLLESTKATPWRIGCEVVGPL